MSEQARQPPIKEFRAGSIHAAVWRKQVTHNGRKWDDHTIRIQRRYKDQRSGQWCTTTYFRVDDLARLQLVVAKVFEYVALREVDESSASTTPNV